MASPAPRLDRYRLIDVIGTGGFSTVYRAVDERFDTHVAIKVLAENHSLNPEVRERFITEVQLLRRLAGIPTVAVYDLGETDTGQPYAVMALADGDLVGRVTSLRSRQVPIGPAEVDRVVDELTRSLSALHAKGIVHRDVKPMNLLVFGDATGADPGPDLLDQVTSGRPAVTAGSANQSDQLLDDSESLRLADLGFAKDLAHQSGLTVGGGTPGFMPPEQGQAGRVDARADIYAATAVVGWLICGEVPVHRTPQEIGQRSAEILGSNASAHGLLAGMARDPGERPATMAEWRDTLRQTLTNPARVVTAGWAPPGAATVPDGSGGNGGNSGGQGAASDRSAGGGLRSTTGRMVLAGAIAGLIGLSAGVAGTRLLSGDGIEISRTAQGVVRTQSEHGVTVAITGPEAATVGQTITFVADVTGASESRWVAPDGSIVDGAAPLSLLAAKTGDAQVTLIASSPAGETVEVTAEFSVSEASG